MASNVVKSAVKRRPPNAGKGRRKGTPNKVTTDVRAAFALLLAGNVDQFQGWIEAVARGEKEMATTREGAPLLDADGNPVMRWLRVPNPEKAMQLVTDLAEYHIPKLARTEINGEVGIRGTLIIRD